MTSSRSSTRTRRSLARAACTPEAGLTDYYPHEVATRRVIIAHAGASYVLADSSKLGTVAVWRVCPLAEITAVLTDSDDPQASKEAVDALAAAGCTVLRAT